MISDHYHEKWNRPNTGYPWVDNQPRPGITLNPPLYPPSLKEIELEDLKKQLAVNRELMAMMRADIEEMKILLKRAKEYDERTGQHECESDDKVALLKKVAEALGVEFDERLLK
jgi:hypothetical protein